MAVSKKGLRKIIVNDREFFWCVKNDDKDDDRLYLVIKSEDKKFIASYMLEQSNKDIPFSPKNSFIIIKGKEFKGLKNLGGCWERFLVPKWEDKIITPSLVAQIINWCFKVEDAVSVDFKGEIIDRI